MLKTKYDTKEAIPQGLETYFKEVDGAFVLQAEGMKTQADVDAVMAVANKEREARREAEKNAKRFDFLPEDFDAEKYNELHDKASNTDVDQRLKEQAERLKQQHTKEIEGLQKVVSEKDMLVGKYVKDAQLEKAMAENGIAPQFAPAVRAMFRDQVKVNGEEVLLNDLPLADSIKAWATSDEGKHFVQAPKNNGGGANGAEPANGKSETTIKRADFDSMAPAAKAKAMESGAKLVD